MAHLLFEEKKKRDMMVSPRQARTEGGAMVCSWAGRRSRGGLTLFIK